MALPTLTVEFAPASTPLATAPTWVDITAYTLSFETDRGFGGELDTVAEAGRASITLNNKDRRFDPTYAAGPYFGNLVPGKQIRIRATYSAVTYDVFRGHIEGYPQTYPGGMFNTEVTLPCVDGTQYLSKTVLQNNAVLSSVGKLLNKRSKIAAWWRRGPEGPSGQVEGLSEYEDLIEYSKPWAYWPVSGSDAAETVPDVVGDKHLMPRNGAVVDQGTNDELVTGDVYPPAAMLLTRASNHHFRTMGLNVPQFKFLTVECVFKLTTLPSVSGAMRLVAGPLDGGGGGDPIFQMWLDGADDLNARVRLTDNLIYTATLAAVLSTSVIYHAAMTYDSATGTLRARLNNGGVAPLTGAGTLALDDPGNNDNIFIGGQPNAASTQYLNGRISHVAVYNRVLSTTTLDSHYTALTAGFPLNDTTDARIGDILDTVAWPASWRDINTGTYWACVGRRWSNQSGLDEIKTTMNMNNDGRFWISPDGLATLYPGGSGTTTWRQHADLNTSKATFGDDPTENRYTDIGALEQDDSNLYNRATAKSVAGEDVQFAEDTTSQAAYGMRALDLGELITNSLISVPSNLVSKLVTRYKDPQTRFKEITIEPEADPTNLWPKVLDYDLCEHITIKKRPMGSADTAITQASHIERISHSCTVSTGNWVTRWTVSPR